MSVYLLSFQAAVTLIQTEHVYPYVTMIMRKLNPQGQMISFSTHTFSYSTQIVPLVIAFWQL